MSARYELIDGEKANYQVGLMCDVLEVSASGYYDLCLPIMPSVQVRRLDDIRG